MREGEERIDYCLAAFVATLQAVERVAPRMRTLHRPAHTSLDRRGPPTLGDLALQSTLGQQRPGLVTVIAAGPGAPSCVQAAGQLIEQIQGGRQQRGVMGVGWANTTPRGDAVGVGQGGAFMPCVPRSIGSG